MHCPLLIITPVLSLQSSNQQSNSLYFTTKNHKPKATMKLFIVLVLCCVAVFARPDGRHIPVLQHTEVHDEHGQYALSYVTANGIAAADQGALKHIGNTNVLVRQGSYTYLGPDGVQYTVRYVADENGFRPEGAHFPVAPEPLPVL